MRDRENMRRLQKLHYERNSAAYKARAAQWVRENPDKRKAVLAKYRSENSDALKAYNREWFAKNKGRRAAYEAARRSLKLQATLPGYDGELVAFYVNCPEGFVVDHMVPLNGKTVCGLHVPWNLQYLPSSVNSSKSNKLIEALAMASASESPALH
jgi:hypothetical protein